MDPLCRLLATSYANVALYSLYEPIGMLLNLRTKACLNQSTEILKELLSVLQQFHIDYAKKLFNAIFVYRTY